MQRFIKLILSFYFAFASFAIAAEETGLNIDGMQFQRESVVQTGDVYKVIIVLIFMLALAAAVLFVLKKKLGIKDLKANGELQGNKINIVDNKRIAPHSTVTLLEVGGDKVLIAINKENIAMTKLSEAATGNSQIPKNDCDMSIQGNKDESLDKDRFLEKTVDDVQTHEGQKPENYKPEESVRDSNKA